MIAGRLDRRIAFQVAREDQSASGEVRLTFVDHAEVWAERRSQAAREAFKSDQRYAEVDEVFRIRYRTDVTPDAKMRIAFEGRAYDIKGVLEVGRREGLDVLATARAE